MPKIPYKAEKCQDDDEDYEIVSFEDFCDKSPGAKTDLLTLNDNINYRLYYESDKSSNFAEGGEPSTRNVGMHTETSLNGPKNASYKRKLSFAPFGRSDKTSRGHLFSSVIPKPRNDGDSSREHRYERFSPRRGWPGRAWEQLVTLFPIMVAAGLLCALCVAAWWAVGGALGGRWGDDHYRRLWERAHPEDLAKKPLSPVIEKVIPTENRYHDHNNLSTKNKINTTDMNRKKDYDKKSGYGERPVEVLREMCANVSDSMRFDCHPQENASEEECVQRGCCWRPGAAPGAPLCYYPAPYDTYRFVNSTENKHGLVLQLARRRDARYPRPFDAVRVDFVYVSDHVLQIKITDAENRRFEPPYPEIPIVSGPISKLKYRVEIDSSAVGFKVIRNDDNVTIVDTQNVGGLILSDKFLQISSVLPTDRVYGLGEKQAPFLNDLQWKTFTLFNQDMPPTENANLYGTHPFYLALEKDGKSHGMALINTNAMDIVLQPTPAITYRTLGGILNFFVLLGPSPQEVVAQYTSLVGQPFLPPYWSLGFHLCKYDYGSLNVTRDVMQRNRDAGIPLDVQWNDLDYMSNGNDFTYDKDKFAGLPEFVDQLHEQGMHYVILVDPGVSASEKLGEYPPFDRGLEMDIFIKNSTDQPFIGKVWNPVSTAWPDFTHPNSTAYWKEMFSDFHKIVKYDGAWIDMNEPSNFVSGPLHGSCAPERLPYRPAGAAREGLRRHTLCMDARHHAGAHFDLHSAHALTEAVATHAAMQEIRGRRPFVLSRGSSPGLGRVSGHWSGDVYSRWHDMRMSIPALLSFSLFGVPMMGTDICGFIEDTTPELCKRWMQLGAFYPFSRNHNTNDAKPQDPASLGGEVLSASVAALRLRYRLLPVYYSLFVRAHLRGDTVARPLFFEFPSDVNVPAIDEQFLIGSHVMITAVLHEGANSTKALFPGKDPWYSLRDGSFLAQDEFKEVTDADMVSVRGGAILPLQAPPSKGPVNTALTRSRPMQLLVAPDADGRAAGELYWDDGDSINTYEEKKYSHIEFSFQNNELNSTVQWWGYGVPSVNSISVLGQTKSIKSVTINNVQTEFTYDTKIHVLCHTCGSKDCNRHDPEISAEPWTNLQIHKQLDQAIEDFYNTILEQFVNSWYSKITLQPFFVDELRQQLRYASASLLRRALKINYARFICDRLVPCALRHYSVSSAGFKQPVHVAASNRSAELKYLRCLTETILPYILRNSECQNSVLRVLVREALAGWALLPLADVLADPHALNTLLLLAAARPPPARPPPSPDYEVRPLGDTAVVTNPPVRR
nr:lysosomal alpha-glucosidase-like isoform X3 [Vanessa tameamea]